MPGNTTRRYSSELRERAVRMIGEAGTGHESEWAAMAKVAELLGIGTPETVRQWVRRAEVDAVDRPGTHDRGVCGVEISEAGERRAKAGRPPCDHWRSCPRKGPLLMTAATPLTWQVGDIRIHRVLEVDLPQETGAWLLPEASPNAIGNVGWLGDPWVDAEQKLRLASQTFAFEVDGQRILVDAGIGNGKTRENPAWHDLETDFLSRLQDAGFRDDDVDLVLITHLHTDHVGWCTREVGGIWETTFGNARHVVARDEWEYWADTELEPARQQMFEDSVDPIRDAGILDTVDTTTPITVAPGITLVPSPGHTPGHATIRIDSKGETAFITGDDTPPSAGRPAPHHQLC